MKEFEKIAIHDLTKFYTRYVKEGINDTLKKEAIELEGKYLGASPLIGTEVKNAVSALIFFYTTKTGIAPPTKEEAKKIIENLNKMRKEF